MRLGDRQGRFNTKSAGRTVVFPKENRIIPVNHLVNARSEKVKNLHTSVRKDPVYKHSVQPSSIIRAAPTMPIAHIIRVARSDHHIEKSQGSTSRLVPMYEDVRVNPQIGRRPLNVTAFSGSPPSILGSRFGPSVHRISTLAKKKDTV